MENLNENERKAIEQFTHHIQQSYPSLIERITLFGSKARQESTDESDIDVLVILNQKSPVLEREIRRYAARISFEHNIIISSLVLDREAWEPLVKARAPFYQEIEADGIDLLEKPAA